MTAGKPIIGDGGFVFELEKRGFVKAGPWTPEATCEFPAAVKQLHTEYARAGADVMQTFTFYASEDKLKNRGNEAAAKFGARNINRPPATLPVRLPLTLAASVQAASARRRSTSQP